MNDTFVWKTCKLNEEADSLKAHFFDSAFHSWNHTICIISFELSREPGLLLFNKYWPPEGFEDVEVETVYTGGVYFGKESGA